MLTYSPVLDTSWGRSVPTMDRLLINYRTDDTVILKQNQKKGKEKAQMNRMMGKK